ncbi:MFS transporter [Candidatus Chloroploca sp. M-50]|uniref:MFS transporter n=1 Tax=Candidatus Chloroploca mongolica TaxID=2528176 RepID=A0ABS4D6F7_9CHLR|nr:MFS transporter [Candidatus Chloroploca mongolica]MBP1465012.1 MFS transporter [Candidatus Chloroploca mongolica]
MAVGYLELLQRNKQFRRLWYGQIVSQLGDWLDSIALFILLLNLTGSGEALGLLLLAEFLPGALVSPLAGVVIDRLPRKLVLIASDLGRAAMVLLLLLVNSPAELWLIYVAVVLKVSMAAFFEPARSAILPSLCTREELVTANAISGATWSAMLAIGAALGGLVAATLGVRAAFLLDAASFLLSAAIIATVQVRPSERSGADQASRGRSVWALAGQAGGELLDGVRYVVRHREVFWLTVTKALWSIGGGVLLLLTLLGREVFPLGRDGALSIGLLYAARGLGTGIGPLLALRLGGDGQRFLRRAIVMGFFVTAAGYLALSAMPTLALAALAVLFAHLGGSVQWVFSTALLQTKVPDQLLGRVFATEYAALTLTTALSAYLTGVIADQGVSPWALSLGLGGVFLVTGTIIGLALWRE